MAVHSQQSAARVTLSEMSLAKVVLRFVIQCSECVVN